MPSKFLPTTTTRPMQELSHRRLLLLPNSTTTANITIASTPSKPPASIDPSSATVAAIVLFCFLFFLGFFSLYARRMFSQEQSHRPAASHPDSAGMPKGLDPKAVGSLPVLPYSPGTYAGTFECVVCLCEFEDGESVKVIPNCGHLFHPKCIDAWLVMIGSCPICRTTKIVGSQSDGREVEVMVVAEGKVGGTGSSGIRSEGCFTVSEGGELVSPTTSRRL